MQTNGLHAITGAFGFSGKHIARRLLDKKLPVRTLTNSPGRNNPFGSKIDVRPLDFDPSQLRRNLEGVEVFYNTYWVRFNHDSFSFAAAVRNLLALFEAARDAGVRRMVHVSITNPSLDSPYEYFRGKARVEKALASSGLSYAILRPAVLFGKKGILINNIAWLLRKFPLFAVFGDGEYRIRPIHADDLAKLAVEQAFSQENTVKDAVGPEVFTYRELVRTIGGILGKNRPILRVPPFAGYLAAMLIGKIVGDVLLTKEEIYALSDNLLYVDSPATGETRLSDWARRNADWLGAAYQSELDRRIGK